jgi:hypothetical protein
MDSDISNLNTYIELIKYTLNKIKNNQTDNITKIVIKSGTGLFSKPPNLRGSRLKDSFETSEAQEIVIDNKWL